MNTDILGLGEVVVDWVAQIDHFPEPDEKIDSINQNVFSGGVTANYIVAASRLGAKTSFIGAIGDDDNGRFLQKDFIKEKVDVSNLIIKKEKSTPVNFIAVVKNSGQKFIIQSPYMHTTIPNLDEINEDSLKNTKILHTTGLYPELTKNAFEIAKKNNISISFDLEKQIAIRGVENLKPLLKHVDVLIPNKAGAMQLTDTKTPLDAAKIFLKWGIKTVIITLGDKGALALSQKEKFYVDALKINPVDTTGAGDTFCAAFDFAYLLKNLDLQESCIFANAAAAMKTQILGARTGMPTLNELKEFLEIKKIEIAKLI